jgi:transcriptional regulator with XRE-family HTH domain
VRYIGKIERQQASPTITVLGKLAEALDVDPADLVRKKSGK